MKVVFMGTPDFAVPPLEYLIRGKYNIACVVTQPDKPKGRGNRLAMSPVKEKALEYKIPVEQPVSIRKDTAFKEKLKLMEPDIIIVAAFGQILPSDVLAIPKYGCINIHASLLPKLRGAAPINWAIINGEDKTGITTMFMDAGLDTGDILMQQTTLIGENETAGSLYDRLKIMGAEMIIKTLKALEGGTLKKQPQDSLKSTYAPMLKKDTGRIMWENSSIQIKNLVRGTNPWPAAFTTINGMKLKVWETDLELGSAEFKDPGTIWKIDKCGIHVHAGYGGILIKQVQAKNGKRIDAYSYTLGHHIDTGTVLE